MAAIIAACILPSYNQAADLTLPTCPDSPNCVSSLANDNHEVAALNFSGQPTGSIHTQLLSWLKNQSNVTVTETGKTILKAEFHTRIFGFVDDLTLMIDPDGMVEVHSASRSGYYDFGVNRRRINKMRKELIAEKQTESLTL